jgi:hypothetical protein
MCLPSIFSAPLLSLSLHMRKLHAEENTRVKEILPVADVCDEEKTAFTKGLL